MANMNTQKSTHVLTTPTAAKRAACETSAESGVPARSGRARRINRSKAVMGGRLARSAGDAEGTRRNGGVARPWARPALWRQPSALPGAYGVGAARDPHGR